MMWLSVPWMLLKNACRFFLRSASASCATAVVQALVGEPVVARHHLEMRDEGVHRRMDGGAR